MSEWIQKSLPTADDVHVDALLGNISLQFMRDASQFAAQGTFPLVPVQKQSNLFATYDRSYWFRDEMKLRAEGTESAGAGFTVSTDSYSCLLYSLHHDVSDQRRANSDSPYNSDRDAMAFLAEQNLTRQEKAFATDFMTTGVWTTDITPGTLWDNAASTPVTDIETGITTVLKSTGRKPNTLTLGYEVWPALKHHPDLVARLDRGQTSGNAMVTLDSVAALLGLDQVIVSEAIETTSKEGQATQTYDFIAGKHALLSHKPSNPGLNTPAAGYTFVWVGLTGSGPQGSRVKRFRMDHLSSDRFEIEVAFDQKLVSANLGYFFNGAVS